MFKGLSTLRKQERKAAVDTEETKKLQAYLSKYTSASGTRPCIQAGAPQDRPHAGALRESSIPNNGWGPKMSISSAVLCVAVVLTAT